MSNAPIVATTSQGLPVGPAADTFVLNGVTCPGQCTLESCEALQAWDIREGAGMNWATAVPNGEKLSEPTFTVEIWEGTVQYPAWLAFCTQFLTRPAPAAPGTVTSKAMGFSHPIAGGPPFNIVSVLFQSVSYRGRGDGGSFKYEVKFLEWKQPLPAQAYAAQTTPATPTGPPSAEDALGQELNDASANLGGAMEAFQAPNP